MSIDRTPCRRPEESRAVLVATGTPHGIRFAGRLRSHCCAVAHRSNGRLHRQFFFLDVSDRLKNRAIEILRLTLALKNLREVWISQSPPTNRHDVGAISQ